MYTSPLRFILSICGAPSLLGASAAASSVLPYGHPRHDVSYPSRPNFTLWLVEEFDEALDLDTDPVWTWSDGGLGEGQVRFVKEAIQFREGKMMLVVSSGEPTPQSCSHAEVGVVAPKNLTSGEMRTRHNMFRYGFYEVSMKAPSVQPEDTQINGNYVSTMFAYRDAKFKHWREIDVEVTGDTNNSMTMNVLNAENTSLWSPSIQATQEYKPVGVNVREDFNTYAFEWLPSGITWYFNGQVVGHHGPDAKLPVPEMSTKIMMNLWIFRPDYAFGGPDGSNNRYPMHSEYDWFRFYKWDGDTSYPCPGMTTTCLTQDDLYLSSNNPCDGIAQEGTVDGSLPCEATCASQQQGSTGSTAAEDTYIVFP